MKKLAAAERAQILHLLCEGESIRSVTRITGASKNTVIKLMIDAGRACAAYHDARVRDLRSKVVQVDEVWGFTYVKQKNVATAKAAPEDAGDTGTWTALDADSKLSMLWPSSMICASGSRTACSSRATGIRHILRRSRKLSVTM